MLGLGIDTKQKQQLPFRAYLGKAFVYKPTGSILGRVASPHSDALIALSIEKR